MKNKTLSNNVRLCYLCLYYGNTTIDYYTERGGRKLLSVPTESCVKCNRKTFFSIKEIEWI